MIIFAVLAYLFLIMASGIQSGFKKVFDLEISPMYMMAPGYYYTWMRSIPMISGVIVGFYPLYLISPFQLNWILLIGLHLVLVVFFGAILQVIYMNAIGYSTNSGKHVFGIMLVGYLMIVINVFAEIEVTPIDQSLNQENSKSIDASESANNPVYDSHSDYQTGSTSHIQEYEQEYENDHETIDTAGMSGLDLLNKDWTSDLKKYENNALLGSSRNFSPDDDKNN